MEKTIDPIWEEIHSSREWGAYPSEHVIRFVARNYYNCYDRGKIRILDFGCGQGANTWFLCREGFDTYAFDGSESAVKKAELRMRKDGLEATFDVFDGTDIKYEDCFFDAVIDNVCIYANRISAIKTMFENVFRVLKNGGRFLTICFGEELSGYRTGVEIESGTYCEIKEGNLAGSGVQHIFNKDELVNCLSDVGFCNIECETSKYTDRGFDVHHYICSCVKND